jgi:hypothetical protein
MNVNPIMGISMNSNTNMNMNANMLNKNKSSINYSNLYINPVLPTEQLKFGVMNRELGIG